VAEDSNQCNTKTVITTPQKQHSTKAAINLDTTGRPKFGFGAESRQMASFGIVSVSVKANKLAFYSLSVSAKTDIDFRSSAEYLF
jgi:hypothetical protein